MDGGWREIESGFSGILQRHDDSQSTTTTWHFVRLCYATRPRLSLFSCCRLSVLPDDIVHTVAAANVCSSSIDVVTLNFSDAIKSLSSWFDETWKFSVQHEKLWMKFENSSCDRMNGTSSTAKKKHPRWGIGNLWLFHSRLLPHISSSSSASEPVHRINNFDWAHHTQRKEIRINEKFHISNRIIGRIILICLRFSRTLWMWYRISHVKRIDERERLWDGKACTHNDFLVSIKARKSTESFTLAGACVLRWWWVNKCEVERWRGSTSLSFSLFRMALVIENLYTREVEKKQQLQSYILWLNSHEFQWGKRPPQFTRGK